MGAVEVNEMVWLVLALGMTAVVEPPSCPVVAALAAAAETPKNSVKKKKTHNATRVIRTRCVNGYEKVPYMFHHLIEGATTPVIASRGNLRKLGLP